MTLNVVITSTPDRESVFAEIWWENEYVGEGVVNERGEVQLRLRPHIQLDLPAQEWIRTMETVVKELSPPRSSETNI